MSTRGDTFGARARPKLPNHATHNTATGQIITITSSRRLESAETKPRATWPLLTVLQRQGKKSPLFTFSSMEISLRPLRALSPSWATGARTGRADVCNATLLRDA